MSSANGAGSRRSKRTRVPLAVVVNCSAPLPPLTSTVSVPAPPSLRSVSSPGFQIMRSLPASPKTWSSASPPVSMSFSAAAEQQVGAALAEQGVVAGLAEELVVARAAGEHVVAGAAEQVGPRQGAVGLAERDRVVAAQAEDLDQRRVRHGRRAAGDGDRAAVDEQVAGRVAAERDRVVQAVAGDGQHAGVEGGGGRRACRDARRGKRAGGEHGSGDQRPRRAPPAGGVGLLHAWVLLQQPAGEVAGCRGFLGEGRAAASRPRRACIVRAGGPGMCDTRLGCGRSGTLRR